MRYPTDLLDAEWAVIAPLIPPARHGGRPRQVPMREVVNALLYLLCQGVTWAARPRDLPPRSTVFDPFRRWSEDGTFWRIHDALFEAERRRTGRAPAPTLGIIDAQAVAVAPKGGVPSAPATTPPSG
jgi:transposase